MFISQEFSYSVHFNFPLISFFLVKENTKIFYETLPKKKKILRNEFEYKLLTN